MDQSVDLLHLIRIKKQVRAIEYALFNRSQRALLRMSKFNFLSENSDTSSDGEYPNIAQIVGYKIETQLDRQLCNNTVRMRKRVRASSNCV